VTEPPISVEHGFRAALGLPREERRGVALCISGGGYRASLFHLGAMTRLEELGILSKIDTFTSVSGGSIALAQLVTHRRSLGDDWPQPGGRVPGFRGGVVEPLRAFTQSDIRTRTLLQTFRPSRWFDQNAGVEGLARHYATGPAPGRADDLPEHPRFVFCATDLRFRTQWTVDTASRLAGSEQAGYGPLGEYWTLARAVAASSCFPPAFRALLLKAEGAELSGGSYAAEDRDELVRGLELSDGGVHDNLGLEPVWRAHRDVLVSDAAPSLTFAPRIGRAVWSQLRMVVTLLEQATDVRKRWLIANYAAGELGGAFWGIGSLPSHYPRNAGRATAPALADDLVSRYLAPVRIDLDTFSPGEIATIENHGYAMADLAVATHASHLEEPGAPPPRLPHGEEPLERSFVQRELADSDRTHLFRRRIDALLRRR
jgi:NTE family protein